jgi:signal transduction histidine kinase
MDPERQNKLITVGRTLLSELDVDTLLRRILDVAREVTGARYAALGILDDRRERLDQFSTVGIDAETRATIGDLPRGRGVLGALIRDPQPLRLADLGAHPQSYGFPLGHPPMTTFLGVPVLVRGEAWGNLYLTEKAGGEFDADDEEAVVVLADWAAIAIQNARLYADVQARRDELERAVRGFETTTEIARALGGETEVDRILELIAKRGRALVAARSIVIGLIKDDAVVISATAGEVDRAILGTEVPLEGSAAGHVLESRRPQRLSELRDRVQFALGDHIEARAGLFVPMLFRGGAVGVLEAFDRLEAGPEFTAEDEHLLVAFAASAATAVATAQTVEAEGLQRSLRAAERERTRWARELHDETLQALGGLRVLLAAARRQKDPDVLGRAVDEAVERLTTDIASLRALITDLRPASLDEFGAQPALEALVARLHDQWGVPIDLHVHFDYEAGRTGQRHAPEVEDAIYRIVQEALTNAIKHGAPTRGSVDVADVDGCVEITVRDDGRGFDTSARGDGFGLIGMRERVALLDGALDVTSSPGAGTTVHVRLPGRRRAAAGEVA